MGGKSIDMVSQCDYRLWRHKGTQPVMCSILLQPKRRLLHSQPIYIGAEKGLKGQKLD